MKFAPLILSLLFLSSCVHQVTVGDRPLTKQLRSPDGKRPLPGAMIWAKYSLPGGLFAPQKTKYIGPYYTGPDGRFTIPPHPFTMTQTGSSLDGDTDPDFVIIHRAYGAFFAGSHKNSAAITFTEPPYNFLTVGMLPPEQRTLTKTYLKNGVPKR